jgi:hypothetical protein
MWIVEPFVSSDVNGSYLFVFSFGQSTGKAEKFFRILNTLDVLRESSILVAGGLSAADSALVNVTQRNFVPSILFQTI